MPRNDASESVLDAAERLFAEHGIATVSDRRIAEAAGNSNHSAVRYYFGGRQGLLEALVERHHQAVQPLRQGRREAIPSARNTLLEDVRAMVLPQFEVMESLESPSWRARFLAQAYVDPQASEVIRTLGHDPVTGGTIFDAVRTHLAHVDREIVRSRAAMMGLMVVQVASQLEERQDRGGDPQWALAGWFLCDAIAGMLTAPVSEPPLPR